MALWEYKVITSGKGGFASPALLEKFLNDLGRDEWEIVHFQTLPDNFLAFTGLARRSTQRDWTLQDAAAAAAKAEAEKLRAEFEAKFKAASSAGGAPAEERAPSFLEEKAAPDDGFRKPVDTSHDAEPETEEEEKADEWDKLVAAEEDELPTFFEAIRPHMRRNQRGPGMSVGVDYLAKKWDQSEEDLKGALAECGFVVPEDEDAKAEYLEYDGDLFWLNVNRRGELWINTKEKPRPVFRPVKAQKVVVEDEPAKQAAGDRKPATEDRGQRSEDRGQRPEEAVAETAAAAEPAAGGAKPAAATAPLPEGPALLAKIRPLMRRNRRGPGGSGSSNFLARALRTTEAELRTAFAGLGFTLPASPNEKPVNVEFGNEVWWLNVDSRGGLWINGREKKDGESTAPSAGTAEAQGEVPLESAPAAAALDALPAPEVVPSVVGADQAPTGAPATEFSAASESQRMPLTEAPPGIMAPAAEVPSAAVTAPAPARNETLAILRGWLKETKSGAFAARLDRLAEDVGRSSDELVAALVGAGLRVPEKPREKPAFVGQADEILWLSRNAKGELWLNAKPSKLGDKPDEETEDEADAASEGGEGEGDKKPPRRGGRGRAKKAE